MEGLGRIMEGPGKRGGLKFWKKEELLRKADAEGGCPGKGYRIRINASWYTGGWGYIAERYKKGAGKGWEGGREAAWIFNLELAQRGASLHLGSPTDHSRT